MARPYYVFNVLLSLFSAYPVFHMQSDWGRYQYTFESAKDACESRGGKLATYKQLLAAWERGRMLKLEHYVLKQGDTKAYLLKLNI